MVIKLNDKSYEVAEGTTLDKFVETLDLQIQGFAVAIDNEVIPRSKWHETTLVDGIVLMMFHAVSGG